jgi:hypothetical protein
MNLLEQKFEQFPEDEFIATEQLNKRIYDMELDISGESLVEFALEIQKNKNISFEAALLKAKSILLSGEDEDE